MHINFTIIYRTNVKRFPPRLPKLKVKLFKRPPKTVYYMNSASAEIMKPPGENQKQVNYDVMIAPGNSFELVTNNIEENIVETIEEPEYSFTVDMSGELPSSGNNYFKQTSTMKSAITTESVPDTSNTEIIYGSPGPDVYRVPDPVILDNSDIHQDVQTKTPPSSSSKPMYKPTVPQTVNLDIPEQDLQEGFIPSAKQYINVFTKEKKKKVTSEKLQKQANIILQEPVIKSTYEQQPLSVSPPRQSQRLQFEKPALFHTRPSLFSSPQSSFGSRPLPAFQSQFQELQSLANLKRPQTFRAKFRDVSQDFRTLFPRQFSDEADFRGFPLSQIYPSSLMSNIASFNANTELVDSKWLMIFVGKSSEILLFSDVGAISSFSFFRPVARSARRSDDRRVTSFTTFGNDAANQRHVNSRFYF